VIPELRQAYPATANAPGFAREHLTAYLSGQHLDTLIPTAALLVSELVTNSVLHGAGPIELCARWAGETLRVDVADRGPGLPALRPAGDLDGRGLHIVEALSTRWGVSPFDDAGKTTWFELQP
jgi:anti-sigma regulatory factor (Ser/Thr protein kinase)